MTVEIALVLSILAVSVLFLVTEWIPMEVVAHGNPLGIQKEDRNG